MAGVSKGIGRTYRHSHTVYSQAVDGWLGVRRYVDMQGDSFTPADRPQLKERKSLLAFPNGETKTNQTPPCLCCSPQAPAPPLTGSPTGCLLV